MILIRITSKGVPFDTPKITIIYDCHILKPFIVKSMFYGWDENVVKIFK